MWCGNMSIINVTICNMYNHLGMNIRALAAHMVPLLTLQVHLQHQHPLVSIMDLWHELTIVVSRSRIFTPKCTCAPLKLWFK